MNLRGIARWLRALSERVEKHSAWLVGLNTVVYLGLVCVLASQKKFWNDELFSFYISRQRSLDDIWNILLSGADALPPSFYLITRASSDLFGSGGLGLRLPEILGFWLMSVSLFYFVRKRSSAVYGLVAMLFPLITSAFYYAFEARPYGLVLGFSGLALLCWQAASDGCMRSLSLAGLGLSLVGALFCHYYAILIFGPLVAGETVRSIIRKRLDLGVWVAFGVGLIPLAIFLPLIKAGARYSANFWAKPHWTQMIGFYENLLFPAVFSLFAIIIILGFFSLTRSGYHRNTNGLVHFIPIHEITAAAGFALLPVAAVILAKTITGGFTDRYAISAVIGVSLLVAWSLSSLVDRRPGVGLAVAAVIFGSWMERELRTPRTLASGREAQAATYQFLQSQSAGKPVVIMNPHLFFELSYYAAARGALPLVYLADVPLALKYMETDTVERGLLGLKKCAPLDVQDFHQFCASHNQFLIYGYPDVASWVIKELVRPERQLVVKARNGDQLLFLVTLSNSTFPSR